MADAELAQRGALTDPTPHVEYFTFTLRDDDTAITPAAVSEAMAMLANATKSIRQKDTAADLTSTIGFGARAWPRLFPDEPVPHGLAPFPELRDGERHFPSTPGDVFLMVKSARADLNLQVGKYVAQGFAPIAELADDVVGFKYLDDRDLIDFVDGTENPRGAERAETVLVADGPYAGGSHLFVQRYLDLEQEWESQSVETQEGVIGRTKLDDIELPDAQKPPYAHNVKSKVTFDGVEQQMFRQNRAFGTAKEHGTMFIGFVADATVIETSLKQMITADDQGHYDKLLDFVRAETGAAYFVPPAAFVDKYAG